MKIAFITIMAIAIMVLSVVGFVGWNNQHKIARGIGNSQKSGVDSSGAKIYQFPYGFDNVAEKCDDRGNLLIVTANANTTSFVQVIAKGCTQ